ncbi:MAG: LacI family DNA-binding transcriptional regulator [Cellvibrionaceae bacterium]
MSIKKVAKIAGVSIATVSRYFNNPDKVSKKTQEKVQYAIDKINYSPNTLAQNLRRGKTGLIITVVPKISSLLYEPIIKTINQLANNKEYTLLVKESGFNSLSLDYFKHMIRCKQSDGFIILTGLAPQAEQTSNEALPIVLACEPAAPDDHSYNLPYLAINYFQAAKDATQHLLRNGHKQIAFIAQDYSSTSTLEQQRGYLNVMQEANLAVPEYHSAIDKKKLSLQDKLNTMIQSASKPTGIYCADDETAIEAMHWIKKNGLHIPQDISVMGFHNTRFAELCDPPLTTINNPMADIGEQAMKILFEIIDSNSTASSDSKRFKHQIIVRESTHPQN